MRINLSNKNKIIVIILLVLVLGGTGGYLLWRVNQPTTVAPTDSDAGNCRYICDGEWENQGCEHGSTGCNCSEDEVGSKAANGNLQCCSPYHKECDTSCGDGTCEGSETLASCPGDCAKCGDNVCTSPNETLASCPGDCAKCGDNVCTSPTETIASCPGDCSVCGDNKCTGAETAESCSNDCLCKDLVWTNKPDGEYTPDQTFGGISVTNINSKSTSGTGITVTLNSTNIPVCSTSTATCYTLSNNTDGYQIVNITLFNGVTKIGEGTYILSLTLPVDAGSCASTVVSTSATFVIKANAVVVVPETGLFDGVMSKIYLGTGFVFLGIITTQFSKLGYWFNILGERNRVILEERKIKKEESKRNRFERRFK